MKSLGALSKSVQAIAVEMADYSKKAFEDGAAATEKLFGAKSLEKAVEVQSDYFKTAYEGFVSQTAKLGELYSDLAQESLQAFRKLREQGGAREVTRKPCVKALQVDVRKARPSVGPFVSREPLRPGLSGVCRRLAAIRAPIIMLSQKQQEAKDRLRFARRPIQLRTGGRRGLCNKIEHFEQSAANCPQ